MHCDESVSIIIQVNEKLESGDIGIGVKRKGDKIGMDYTHGAVTE